MPRTASSRPRYVPAIGPRLKKLLFIVFLLFSLLAVNSAYLGAITLLEWVTSNSYQDYFYQLNFLFHLAAGLLIIAPTVVFGLFHMRNAWRRPNRRAVCAGVALFCIALSLMISGLALTRFDFFEIRHPRIRSTFYWLHVITPLLAAWMFVLHRLAGTAIRWNTGVRWALLAATASGVMVLVYIQDPQRTDRAGPASEKAYFFPSLSRTATGNFIPAKALMMDRYCRECHMDAHKLWEHSAHRLSSFNNPAYLFSVRNTREKALQRDGHVQASRFCAGCHDPVPFFSGAFDDPDFDDIRHPTADAGITCTVCHAITHVNSPRGNADFTIEEPAHYPFTFSDSTLLQWVNRQLIKAKPAFHKQSFLKPLHKSSQFCGTCHKVHLPVDLNRYKWLRGQNHLDSFHLSGVSGHGVSSFYYPPTAVENCAKCHMPEIASNDFGARPDAETGRLKIHNHLFPAANTALPWLKRMSPWVNEEHQRFLRGSVRVDIFGIREQARIDG